MKNIVTGILAHVDAGKTTLSEAILYATGKIKNAGRVDGGSAHLDTHALERQRGITIFSAQAAVELENTRLVLLDTPGHVDFCAETERALCVLDYAVLVISGTDGVQAHTETLWRLLARYEIPTFIFVTKMDMPGADRAAVLRQLQSLHPGCADFSNAADWAEEAAVRDDALLAAFLESGTLEDAAIAGLIRQRRLFPCCFGSGLKQTGITELLTLLDRFTAQPDYPNEFAAVTYKISRDAQGNRLTWLKVTGGELSVRAQVSYTDSSGNELTEKVSQLRIYSGDRFVAVDSVAPGCIAAALGLSATCPCQALGAQPPLKTPLLEPVLNYRVLPPAGCDARTLLSRLKELEEEDPQLRVCWNERLRELTVQLMGEVQTEILKSLLLGRWGLDVAFDQGRILYRETITNTVEGVGHFEPLRHYAEVHLLLEPGAPGSGVTIASRCSTDELSLNWQRLILYHLKEKRHAGVLTGAPVTDIQLTLVLGRAHLKHTEGGDFREATYRAVRQGLMKAQSLLLEPVCDFSLELPTEFCGRALSDISRMFGSGAPQTAANGITVITGSAPVATMRGYAAEVAAYTRGRGRLFCKSGGYAPCHNAEVVMAAVAYDPERDPFNSPNSIFCVQGAGHEVKWNEVEKEMHLPSVLRPRGESKKVSQLSDEELEGILRRAVGPIKRPQYGPAETAASYITVAPPLPPCKDMFIDGYNVIFGWEELKELATEDIAAARRALLDILANYCGYHDYNLTVVFDAYMTDRPKAEHKEQPNLQVVYTAKDEPADIYIAKALSALSGLRTRVVTSDRLIQLAALGSGVLMTSAREFRAEVEATERHIAEIIQKNRRSGASSIAERIQREE